MHACGGVCVIEHAYVCLFVFETFVYVYVVHACACVCVYCKALTNYRFDAWLCSVVVGENFCCLPSC